MKNERTILGRVVVCLALLLALGTGPAAADWEFVLTPYFWASDVALEVEIDDEPVIGADVDFSDLIDKVDFALMAHFEARNEGLGLFGDLLYLDLSNDNTAPDGNMPPAPPPGTATEAGLTMTVWEFGGFYRPSGESHGFDILLGVRVIDLDQELTINFPMMGPIGPVERGIDESFTDGFVGVRYANLFNDRWTYFARVDYSAGGTEGVLNAAIGIGYEAMGELALAGTLTPIDSPSAHIRSMGEISC